MPKSMRRASWTSESGTLAQVQAHAQTQVQAHLNKSTSRRNITPNPPVLLHYAADAESIRWL